MNTPQRPNIVILYADDLGFGDVSCYGASRIPTPNIDRLAAGGRLFHDAHATAATCTPSRYSLLTGAYPWRNPRAAILDGGDPLIIEPGSCTIPSLLGQAGYYSAVIGKWHLGLGDGHIDWNGSIRPGPQEVGFDHNYMMAATNDRVPCVYIEDDHVANLDPQDPISVTYDQNAPPMANELPEGRHHPELLRYPFSHQHDNSIVGGVSRIGRMAGGASALWNDETMSEVFLAKAKSIVSNSTANEQPFFLYYAFHQPHVPRIPAPQFVGATDLGARGDVIVEMDWAIGQFLDHLEAEGQRENTLVIFSSDNGPILDDGYHDQAVELNGDHRPAGPLRGGKYSLFDGGTRVPTIVSWPGVVEPGESDELICQSDFLASFAKLVGIPLPNDAGPDSFDVLAALLGRGPSPRDELLLEGMFCSDVLRQGSWVCIPPHDGPPIIAEKNAETGFSPKPQLYNMNQDIGQMRDLANDYPDKVLAMRQRVATIHSINGTRREDDRA